MFSLLNKTDKSAVLMISSIIFEGLITRNKNLMQTSILEKKMHIVQKKIGHQRSFELLLLIEQISEFRKILLKIWQVTHNLCIESCTRITKMIPVQGWCSLTTVVIFVWIKPHACTLLWLRYKHESSTTRVMLAILVYVWAPCQGTS